MLIKNRQCSLTWLVLMIKMLSTRQQDKSGLIWLWGKKPRFKMAEIVYLHDSSRWAESHNSSWWNRTHCSLESMVSIHWNKDPTQLKCTRWNTVISKSYMQYNQNTALNKWKIRLMLCFKHMTLYIGKKIKDI